MKQYRTTVAKALVPLAVATGAILAPVAAPATAEAATAGYALFYTKLPNGKSVPIRWNGCQKTITYKVNLAAVPSKDRAALLAETQASVRALASKTKFSFTYKGQTTEVPKTTTIDKQSAELVIAFTTPSKTNLDLSGRTMGQGGFRYRWWSTSQGDKVTYTLAATRGYVVFDTPDMYKYTKKGYGVGTYRTNLIQHELGHAFGLNHVNNTRALMNPMISSASPKGFSYSGDTAGLAKIGKGAGCINMTGSGVVDLN